MLDILLHLCKSVCFFNAGSGSSHGKNQTIPGALRGQIASNLSGLLGYNVSPSQSIANNPSGASNRLQKQIGKIQGQETNINQATKGGEKRFTKDQQKLAELQGNLSSLGLSGGGTSSGQPTIGSATNQQDALQQLIPNLAQFQQLGNQANQLALDPTSSSTYQQMMNSLQQTFLNNLAQSETQTGSKYAAEGGQYSPNTSSPLAQAFAQQTGLGEQALSSQGLQAAFNLLPTEQTQASQYAMTIPNLLAQLASLLGAGSSASSQVSGGI